jgi:N-acetylneuraminic acid mutarotase
MASPPPPSSTTRRPGAGPRPGRWHPTAAPPVGLGLVSPALLADGRALLVATAPVGTPPGEQAITALLYDPRADRWASLGTVELAGLVNVVALADGRALLLGAAGQVNDGTTPALLLDPATGQQVPVPLPDARGGFSTTRLTDGGVLVAGGASWDQRNGGQTTILDTTLRFDPASGTWSDGPALAHARANHTALTLADGRVLVLGGEGGGWVAQAELYDPQAGRWAAAGALDPARGHFAATALADGRALVTGGDAGYVRSVWLADAALFTPPARAAAPGATATPRPAGWRTGAPLSTARSALTLTPLRDGTVLAVGGDTTTGATATTERYDPVADRWVRAGDLAAPRQGHAAVALRDGRVFVVGGGNSATPSLATAEAYDPATDRWATTAPLPQAFARALATVFNDGRVLVVGAPAAGAPPEQALAILYDPATDRWSVPAKVPAQAVSALLTLPDGRAFLAGNAGQGKPNGRDEPTILLFDPGTAAWQTKTPPQATLLGAAAALLPDGTVFVAGGLEPPTDAAGAGGGTPAFLSRADRYDPVADRWTALAPLPVGRGAAGIVTLTTGQVLVVGGDRTPDNPTGVGYRGRADRYDPAGDRWLASGTLPGGRDAFAIAALPNGQAIVAGGGFVQANSFVRFATVDRYTAPGTGTGVVPAPTATRPVPTVPPTPMPGP